MNSASNGIIQADSRGDVSVALNDTSFPLHDAASEGRPETVRLLLGQGHSATALDGNGLRASARAREAGHDALADELEDREAEILVATSVHAERTHLSIKELIGLVQGRDDAVPRLISAGRIRAVDGKGDTPLHICAARGRLQLCDQLIKAGADPAAMNFDRKRPDERAAENGHLMVAGLLRSLLPDESPGTTLSLDGKASLPETGLEPPQRAMKDIDASFDFDDLDLDFEGEEEAEQFHRDIERGEYAASFDAVEGRVTRLGDDDGAEFDFDHIGESGFRIDAEDIVDPLPVSAENADAATFRSYLDVRSGRKPSTPSSAPTTRYHAISDEVLLQWVENAAISGACTEEDIDVLIGEIRGSFDAETVRSNLVRELRALGFLAVDEEDFFAGQLPDTEDVADALSCICNGSNMRPGVELKPLSARAEARLFREMNASRESICRTLSGNAMLVSVVVMLGERIEAGTVDPGLLTDLDILHGRETPDREILAGALSYLAGYQTLLDDGDISSEDREDALDAVSALRLSRTAVELIATGIEASPELADLRISLEASLAVQERCRREILLAHMPLVWRQASRREHDIADIDDLVHDGVFGLMRSIDKFEADRGHRFMTYCQYGVRQSMIRALEDTGSLVRVPSHRALVLRRVDRLEETIPEGLPTEEVISKLAEDLDLSPENIRDMRRIPRRPVSLDDVPVDCADMETPQFRDRFAVQRREIIEEFLEDMPLRNADIIVRRFGLRDEDELTLEELGVMYGVTRERVRQIEAKSLAKMGHPRNSRLLRSLL